jgi:hypothetical protein
MTAHMDLIIKYIERDWYKILPQTPSLGLDYSSHGGEHCKGLGEGGEAAGGNSVSGSPSNLPPMAACSLFVSLFLISAFVHHGNKNPKVYIDGFRSKQREWRCNRWHPRFDAQDQWYHVVGLVGPFIFTLLGPLRPILSRWMRIQII